MQQHYTTPMRPTPKNIVTFCTFHDGIIRKLDDPECRGRVKCEVPGIFGTGKDNWTGWIPYCGYTCGSSNKGGGDEGFWNPPQVGQGVAVGFLAGERLAQFAIPGQLFLESDKGKNKQMLPKEQKAAGKEQARDATRMRMWKSEAGHTLLFDDRGKKEKLALVDWTGAGLHLIGPGKQEDEKEKEKEESKPRKGERRGTRMTVAGTAKKPGEICRDGFHLLSLLGLNTQGFTFYAEDDAGLVAVWAATKDGEIGPSILLDAKNDDLYLSAGKEQIQILGSKGHIRMTRRLIKELEEDRVVDATEVIKGLLDAQKKEFEEFKE